jgi:hypothetical protein
VSWTNLISDNRVTVEPSSKSELDSLRTIVGRCLSDINATGLSHEQRFIIAYDAARTLALMIVRSAGYRPKRFGGHFNTFEGLKAADPAKFQSFSAYLQICRMKRNDSEYDAAGGITNKDADELVKSLSQFAADVEAWISSHHPAMTK